MIELMIEQVKPYLPLKIEETNWDGTVFHMYGTNWSFSTLSSWRVSTTKKMIFGCYDNSSLELLNRLKKTDIIGFDIQTPSLTIDPVFLLSNQLRLEIFSTDVYEPWTFNINQLCVFVPTPGKPESFL
jgi:hypothetical protein